MLSRTLWNNKLCWALSSLLGITKKSLEKGRGLLILSEPAIHDLHFNTLLMQETTTYIRSQVFKTTIPSTGYFTVYQQVQMFSWLNSIDLISLLSSCFLCCFLGGGTDVWGWLSDGLSCHTQVFVCPQVKCITCAVFFRAGHDQSCSQRRHKDKRSRILPDARAAEGGGPASPPLFWLMTFGFCWVE